MSKKKSSYSLKARFLSLMLSLILIFAAIVPSYADGTAAVSDTAETAAVDSAETSAEDTSEQAAESTTLAAAETTAEPTTQAATPTPEPTTQAVTESTAEPTTQAAAETTAEPTTQATAESAPESTTQAVSETPTEATTEIAAETTTGENQAEGTTEEISVTETKTAETTETIAKTTTKNTTEDTTETTTEAGETITYTCEVDDDITILAEASPECALPADAVLHVDALKENSEEYKAVSAAIEKALNEALITQTGQGFTFMPCDIYFVSGDARIEPESGSVKIRMEIDADADSFFKDAKEAAEEAAAEAAEEAAKEAAEAAAGETAEETSGEAAEGTAGETAKETAGETAEAAADSDGLAGETDSKIPVAHVKSDNTVEFVDGKLTETEETFVIEFTVTSFSVMTPVLLETTASAASETEAETVETTETATETETAETTETATETETVETTETATETETAETTETETAEATETAAETETVETTETVTETETAETTETATETETAETTETVTETETAETTETATEETTESTTEVTTETTTETTTEATTETSTETTTEAVTETSTETTTEVTTEAAESVTYTCEVDDNITIVAKASPECGIPADAVLHADALEDDAEKYDAIYDAIEAALNETLMEEEAQGFLFMPYDIYFLSGDTRIEPETGSVKIRMEIAADADSIFWEAKEAAEEAARLAAEEAAREAAEEAAQKAAEEAAAEAAEETAGEATEETAGETVVETAEEAAKETAGAAGEETSGETAEVTSGEATEETAGAAAEETSGETTEETSEAAEETAGETVVETAGETAVETAGEAADSSETVSEIPVAHIKSDDTTELLTGKVTETDNAFIVEFTVTSFSVMAPVLLETAYSTASDDGISTITGTSTDADTSDAPRKYSTSTTAYAVLNLDSTSESYGVMEFVRASSEEGAVERAAATGVTGITSSMTKGTDYTVYTGFEGSSYSAPWDKNKITKIVFTDKVRPQTVSTAYSNGWFSGCSSLTSVDARNLDTSALPEIQGIFQSCSNLTEVDVTGWDTTNVTKMKGIFRESKKLRTIKGLNTWDTSNVTYLESMFYCDSSLEKLDLSHWNTDKVTTAGNLTYNFNGCTGLEYLNLSGWNLAGGYNDSSITLFNNVLGGGALSSLKKLILKNCTFGSCTTLYALFANLSGLETVDVTGCDTSNITSLKHMFYNDPSLETVTGLDTWDTSSVTDMYGVFYKCTNLGSLSLGNWDTSKVTTMREMFDSCENLTSLDVSSWNTSSVENMYHTFCFCYNLKYLTGLGDWDTSGVATSDGQGGMGGMFAGDHSLEILDLSGFVITASTNTDAMLELYHGVTDKKTNLISITVGEGFQGPNAATALARLPVESDGEALYWRDATSSDHGTYIATTTGTATKASSISERHNGDNALTQSITYSRLTTISFYANGGRMTSDVPSDAMYAGTDKISGSSAAYASWYIGQIMDPLPTAVRTGYYFTGWNTKADGTGTWMKDSSGAQVTDGTAGIPTEQNYYAQWTPIEYTIILKPNGSSGTNGRKYLKYDVDYKLPTGKGDIPFEVTTSVEDETTGETTTEIETTYQTFARTGYTLTGWSTSKNGTTGETYDVGETIRSLTDTDDTTIILYAQWTWDDDYVKITFDSDDGSRVGDKPETVEGVTAGADIGETICLKGTEYASLPEPYKSGYTFIGWKNTDDNEIYVTEEIAGRLTHWKNRDSSKIVTLSDSSPLEVTKNLNLKAVWEENPKVTFDYNEYDADDDETDDGVKTKKEIRVVSYGASLGTLPTLPSTDDRKQTFIGWFTADGEQVTEESDAVKSVTKSVTYYAHWGWQPKFNTNGGTLITSTLDCPIKEITENDGTYPINDPNKTQNGSYTINTLPTVTRKGYKFDGWYWTNTSETDVTVNGVTVAAGEKIKLEDRGTVDLAICNEITAHWTELETVTVTLDPNGGAFEDKSTASKTIEYYTQDEDGNSLTSITLSGLYTATKANCNFLGWKASNGTILYRDGSWTDADGVWHKGDGSLPANLITTNEDGTKSITLTAQWKEETLTIKFDPNTASVTNSDGTVTIYEGVMYDSATGLSTTAPVTQKVVSGGTLQSLPGAWVTEDTETNTLSTAWVLKEWNSQADGTGTKLTTDTVLTGNSTWYAIYKPANTVTDSTELKYTFGARWVNVTNANVDNVNGNLEFHPVTDNDQTAQLYLNFEINDIGANTTLPEESVEIRVPKYLWEDWNKTDVGTDNIDNSGMPKYENKNTYTGNAYFAYKTDPDNPEYYILTNIKPLEKGYKLELSISYTVDPALVNGGGIDSDGNYVDYKDVNYYKDEVPVTLKIDIGKDGTVDKTSTADLSVEMHTEVEPVATKSSSMYTKIWNSAWGDMPASEEDSTGTHFYVAWTISANYSVSGNNQPFTCSWSEDTVHDGEVVGYVISGTFYTKAEAEALEEFYDRSTATSFNGNSAMRMENDLVIVKYPMSLLEELNEAAAKAKEAGETAPTLTLTNSAVLTTNWKSGYVTEKRVNASIVIPAEADDNTNNNEDDPGTAGGSEPEIKDTFYKTRASGWGKDVDGGQETILDDGNDVELKWTQYYSGNGGTYTNKIPVSWNESSGDYEALERTICIEDGISGDLLYSSCASETATIYKWKPSMDNTTLEDSDYNFTSLTVTVTEKDAQKVGNTWTDSYTSTDFASYGEVRIYLRSAGSSEFELYQTVAVSANETNTAGVVQVDHLPSGTVGYQIQYDSDFYSTELQVDVMMALHATQRVKKLLQADVDLGVNSLIKNTAHCKIWRPGSEETLLWDVSTRGADTDSAENVIYELNISETWQKTVKKAGMAVKNADENGNPLNSQDAPMYIAGWNYNTGDREKRMTKGEFYDLLPTGTTVDTSTVLGLPITGNVKDAPYSASDYSTVAARTDLLSKSCYTVSFTENWRGSGRTMMKITFAIPDEITAVGAQFWYKLRNSDSNIQKYGTTVQNYVAFVNTTDGAVKPAGCSETIAATETTTESMKKYYEVLDSMNSGWISYGKASVNYEQSTMSEKTFVKTVNTNDGTGYGKSGSTILSNEYTYCLSYQVTSDSISKNIVIYDILEHEANRGKVESGFIDSQWYGILKSVDVSEIAAIRNSNAGYEAYYCKPVVYYYVVEGLSAKDSDFVTKAAAARDTLQENDAAFVPTALATTSGWKTTMPDDRSTIIAIAVDCSKDEKGNEFIFQGTDTQKELNLYLVMTAPDTLPGTEEEIKSLKAYNEAVIYSQASSDTNITPMYSSSSVTTLEELDPTITKTSDPASGKDIENPAPVGNGGELTYTLDIKNTNTYFSITDVVVEDVIADDLAVDPSKIKVYYGEDIEHAILIGNSPLAEIVSTTSGATYTKTVKKTVTTTDENGDTTTTTEETEETTKGLKIKLKITGEISPGDTVHFLIPTTVNAETSGTVIKNTAVIVSVGGKSRDISSETTYHQVMAGLTIEKTVAGSMGNKVKDFHFRVYLTAKDGTVLPESVYYTRIGNTNGNGYLAVVTPAVTPTPTAEGSEDSGGTGGDSASGGTSGTGGDSTSGGTSGTGGDSTSGSTGTATGLTAGMVEFTLAHSEKIELNLPEGVTYQVVEYEASDGELAGYTVSYKINEDGSTVTAEKYKIGGNESKLTAASTTAATLQKDGTELYFTNTNEMPVPTAAHTGTRPLILFAAAAGLGLAGLSISRRRRRKRVDFQEK